MNIEYRRPDYSKLKLVPSNLTFEEALADVESFDFLEEVLNGTQKNTSDKRRKGR